MRSWERIVGRTVFFLWDEENTLNRLPVGIENLPTEPGLRVLFADVLNRKDISSPPASLAKP